MAVHTSNTGLSNVRLADYFDPEYGGMTLLRDVGKYIPVYTASSKGVDPVSVGLTQDIWAMCETTARTVLT